MARLYRSLDPGMRVQQDLTPQPKVRVRVKARVRVRVRARARVRVRVRVGSLKGCTLP